MSEPNQSPQVQLHQRRHYQLHESTAPDNHPLPSSHITTNSTTTNHTSLTSNPHLTQALSAQSASAPTTGSPHNTEWKDVSLMKFCGLTVFFSTLENALFYPFYVLKTREQADSRVLGKSPWSASRAHLRTLLADQGVRGLYRGFVSSNLTAFPAYGVYMGVYSWAKSELGYEAGEDAATGHVQLNPASIYAPFIAGLVADGASVALYVPGDVVVQRLQIKNSPYASFGDACRQIYATDGMQGFFRGFGATFVTSGIASAVWWVIYENVKNEMYVTIERRKRLKEAAINSSSPSHSSATTSSTASTAASSSTPPSLWSQLVGVNRVPQIMAGFVAGTITSVLINPLDVVKTRLQVQDTYGQKAHDAATQPPSCTVPPRKSQVDRVSQTRYRNMFHGLYRIYKDEGFRGYWRGVMPKLVSRGPLSAMSSLLYEVVMYLSKTDEAQARDNQATKHQFH